jgi:hypothetical protein
VTFRGGGTSWYSGGHADLGTISMPAVPVTESPNAESPSQGSWQQDVSQDSWQQHVSQEQQQRS